MLIGCVFLVLGYIINAQKIRLTRWAAQAYNNGKGGYATITAIKNTNLQHNNRRVKEYIFTYYLGTLEYKFRFKSAYHRQLKTRQQHLIFILPEDPNVVFVPFLFFKNIERFENENKDELV
ncbi:hypothetical protein GC194_09710 [bacterium]|nr:hypothetical protein [bacterium]